MSQIADEILAIEKGFFWTRADDPQFFEENLADKGISVIEPMGFITKGQAVTMTAPKVWKDVEMHDVVLQQVTPDCVTLAYHGQGTSDGDEPPVRSSIASTYVRQNGRWRLALTAHQPWKQMSGEPIVNAGVLAPRVDGTAKRTAKLVPPGDLQGSSGPA